jgi:hypothetical protein
MILHRITAVTRTVPGESRRGFFMGGGQGVAWIICQVGFVYSNIA